MARSEESDFDLLAQSVSALADAVEVLVRYVREQQARHCRASHDGEHHEDEGRSRECRFCGAAV